MNLLPRLAALFWTVALASTRVPASTDWRLDAYHNGGVR